MPSPVCISWALKRCATASWRTLAVGPTGRSISTWLAPAATFFEITDATSCPSLSRSSARSTRITISSVGLRLTEPPHAMQAPSCSTTARMRSKDRLTGAIVSMVSAVPAGDVMAREDVLGISKPQAATIGTTIGVVRLPGSPPTQCLSMTGVVPQSKRRPDSTIARVIAMVSLVSSN